MASGETHSKNGRNQEHLEDFQSMAKDQAEKLFSCASDKAHELGKRLAHGVNEAITNAGEKVASFSETLRAKAPRDGAVGNAASSVADTLKTGGQYFADHEVSDIADDVTKVVKKYPVYSLWVGVGIGFLLGSCLTSSKR